jgi:putative glutathione S-transferase
MAAEVHKYGTDDGWHGIIQEGGEFPPEKDRYHLFIGKRVSLPYLNSGVLPPRLFHVELSSQPIST